MSQSDAATAKQQQKIPGCGEGEMANLSKSAKRNMKRKEKRKQQQHHHHQDGDGDGDLNVDYLSSAVENVTISEDGRAKDVMAMAVPGSCSNESTAAEKAKKIKNLKKKLRQIEELQQKVEAGEIKEPTKDQLEKLGRAETLQAELQQMEAGS